MEMPVCEKLEVFDELEDFGLADRGVEVADQMARRASHSARAGPDAKGDGLGLALDRRGRDAEAIATPVVGPEVGEAQRVPVRRGKEHDAVADRAKHFLVGAANYILIFQHVGGGGCRLEVFQQRLAIASLRARLAASRYFSIRNEELCSAWRRRCRTRRPTSRAAASPASRPGRPADRGPYFRIRHD